MVTLTRLTGSVFALNSDLIERVDSTPDTVITLIDGTTYVVREALEEVVARVRRFRGSVIAAASLVEPSPGTQAEEPVGPADAHTRRDANVVPFPNRGV